MVANHDPHNQGRIRVSYYWQQDGATSWVRLLSPHAGSGRGFLFLPEVGDEVLICFEEGDPERPYAVGSAWNGVHQPPSSGFHAPGSPNGAEFAPNNVKRLVTKSGHRITMVDTPGKETVSIATPQHNRLMLTEQHADTGRPAIVLATAGDLILSAPNGRIHSHSATHSREVGAPVFTLPMAQAHVFQVAYIPPQTPAKPAFHALSATEQAKLAKKDRVAYRKSLIAAGRDQAGTMPPGKERDELLAQCSQFEADNKAVENARLSAAVYSSANAPGGAGQVEGCDRVDPSTLKGKLSNPNLWNPPSGMQAALFHSQTDGNYVVAYKGTSSMTDFRADASQSMSMRSQEYQDAMKLGTLTSQDQEISPSLTFTGHSLGGGEAAAAAIVTQKPAETFNAAGVNQATLAPFGATIDSADQYIQNYQVPKDIVSRLQGSTVDSILRYMSVGGL